MTIYARGLFIIFICFTIVAGCKSKQKAIADNTHSEQSSAPQKTIGKVSHQYRETGCATVIIVNTSNDGIPLILIPKDKLESKYDVDGKEILFTYHTLRMPQPVGCTKGIPAELNDISLK